MGECEGMTLDHLLPHVVRDINQVQDTLGKLKGRIEHLMKEKKKMDEETQQFYQEREQFEKEKAMCNDLNLVTKEKIDLNVGGKKLSTTKATLNSIEGTMLSAMFSGRHRITTDKDGYYFIDRDPKLFRHILNYLRDHKLQVPTLKQESLQSAIFDEFDYFCIPCPSEISEKSPLNYKHFGMIKSIGHGFMWIGNIKICGKSLIACGVPRQDLYGLLLFDMESNEISKWLKKSVLSVDMAGNIIVAGGIKNMWIIDINTGLKTKIRTPHDHVDCLKIYDGKIITGSRDCTLKMWDMVTGEFIQEFDTSDGVYHIDIAENIIATCSPFDPIVKIWNYYTSEHIVNLDEHESGINCIKIHKNWVISGSLDTTIKLWDNPTWTCVRTLQGHVAPVRSLSVYSNTIVSGSDDATIRVWDLRTGGCVTVIFNCTTPALDVNEDSIVGISQDGAIKIWKGVC